MAATPISRPRVLVANDERLIAETLRIILDRNGFETTCVYSGRHAIEAARTWQPHIFLSEALMPGMTGIDAAIQIRAIHPDCRVLLLADPTSPLAHGFQILRKPIPPTELLERLRAALKNLPASA